MAILLVDKSLAELGRVADRAVIVQRGSTVWDGRFADLVKILDIRNVEAL